VSKNGVRHQAAAAARRQRKPPAPKERGYDGLHVAIADYFRAVLPPEVVWLHVPNGEKRDKATAALLERMGVLAGAPDFFLFWPAGAIGLEVKAPSGRFSPEQSDVAHRLAGCFVRVFLVRSVPAVEATLKLLGVPMRGGLS
jgi:hypothetical protein